MGVRYCMGVPCHMSVSLLLIPMAKNLLIIDNAGEGELLCWFSAYEVIIQPRQQIWLSALKHWTLPTLKHQATADIYIDIYNILYYIYNMYLCGRGNKITVSNSDSDWSVRLNQLANPLKIDGIHFHRHIDSCPHGSSWGSCVCREGTTSRQLSKSPPNSPNPQWISLSASGCSYE